MERWSRSDLGKHIRFLCVCVEGVQTAAMFNSMVSESEPSHNHHHHVEQFPNTNIVII